MGRYVFATIVGAVVVLAPLGCSLLLGEGFTDPHAAEAGQTDPTPTRDATTVLDGGAIAPPTTSDVDAAGADAVDADAAADPNLLVNPGFETPDCAGWLTEFAVATDIALPHSGARGCLVCGVAGNYEAQFYQAVPMTVPSGAAYLGQLWVRAAPSEAAPDPAKLGLEVDVRLTGQYPLRRGSPVYATKPLSSEWERINAAVIASNTDAGYAVQVFLHFPAQTRTCVVVDTARLVLTAN